MLVHKCENCKADCPFADNPPLPCNGYKQRENLTNLDLMRALNREDLAELLFYMRVLPSFTLNLQTVGNWYEWLGQKAKYTDGTPPRHWKDAGWILKHDGAEAESK